MARYTRADLTRDIGKINQKIQATGYRIEIEKRNNSLMVDIYRGDVCLHAIGGGSARDAHSLALAWVVRSASEIKF